MKDEHLEVLVSIQNEVQTLRQEIAALSKELLSNQTESSPQLDHGAELAKRLKWEVPQLQAHGNILKIIATAKPQLAAIGDSTADPATDPEKDTNDNDPNTADGNDPDADDVGDSGNSGDEGDTGEDADPNDSGDPNDTGDPNDSGDPDDLGDVEADVTKPADPAVADTQDDNNDVSPRPDTETDPRVEG